MIRAVLLFFLLTSILFSDNFCKKNILNSFDNINIHSYPRAIRYSDIEYKYQKQLNYLSKLIIYFEPFNSNLLNEYVSILNRNENSQNNVSLLYVLEIGVIFNIDNNLSSIKKYYIKNFSTIRNIYLKNPTLLRYYVLEKLDILSKEDLNDFKKKINKKADISLIIFEDIKNGKIKNVQTKAKSVCSSLTNIKIKRRNTTALDLSVVFMKLLSFPEEEFYFLKISKNVKLYYFYKYLYTKNIEYYNKIVINKKELVKEASEAVGQNKIYKAWILSDYYINHFNNKLNSNNIKSLNIAKDINLVTGEDISSNFYNNKDFENYIIIKSKTIQNSLKLIKN